MPARASFLTMLALLAHALFGKAAFADHPTLAVWPADVPGGLGQVSPDRAAKLRKQNVPDRVFMVDSPTLTLYMLDKSADGPNSCVVVCPGGGYNVLAWAKEGTEIAEWLNSIGVSAAVLKYRVPRRSAELPHAAPLQDAQRAVRVLRQKAQELHIDPTRLGMLGFSAGGNLTVMAGLHAEKQTYEKLDAADEFDCRPDFLIPIYPAYLGHPEDSKNRLSDLVKITRQSPPTFIAVTQDDKDRGIHSALLFAALTRAGVKAELHVYTKGGHGYGLRPSPHAVSKWPDRCADWMRASGYAPSLPLAK